MNIEKSEYDNLSELSLARKYFLSESDDERKMIISIFREKLKIKSYQNNSLVESRINDILLKAKLSKPEHEDLIFGLSIFSIVLLLSIIAYVLMVTFFNYELKSTILIIFVATLMINEYIYSSFSGIVHGRITYNKIKNPYAFGIIRNLYLIIGLLFYTLLFVL